MSKNIFKKIVKNACKNIALEEMIKEKEKLSKMEHCTYSTLKMQDYLMNKNISMRQKKLLFKLRCRMTKVGYNFGKKVPCPLCKIHEDSQEKILDCIILKINCEELYQQKDEKYEDIFSPNLTKLEKIANIFQKCFESREELLEQQTDKK